MDKGKLCLRDADVDVEDEESRIFSRMIRMERMRLS